MDERAQIVYMQMRLIRLASEKWKMSIPDVCDKFSKYDIFNFVDKCFGLFHVQGDNAILYEIEQFIEEKQHG